MHKKNKHQHAIALLQKEGTRAIYDSEPLNQFIIKLAFPYHGAFQGKETNKNFINKDNYKYVYQENPSQDMKQ